MTTFTFVHVLISLAAIVSGFVVLFALTRGRQHGWTGFFLATTVLTSVTGFLFPFHKLLPSHVIAAISLVVLAASMFALYARHLAGAWRSTYVITATIALYFNVFVLVAQAFQKTPALKRLAPTQSEPPFAIAQCIVLLLFIVLGVAAVRGFRQKASPIAMAAAK
jgi:hypothetical protein